MNTEGQIQPSIENPWPRAVYTERGELVRPPSEFRDSISQAVGARFPPAKARYHLYISYACPWAHRTLIVRALKGLQDVISVSSVHPHNEIGIGWRFATLEESKSLPGFTTPDPHHPDVTLLRQLYFKANANYTGRFTVPILWDLEQKTIVNNESSEIIRMFYTEFDDHIAPEFRAPNVDLYPVELQASIDQSNEWIYSGINHGVYRAGLCKSQVAYSEASRDISASLARVEAHLAHAPGPYFWGSHITETDVRLFVTLVRFDPVYVTLFKTNLDGMLRHGFPNINKYLKNLYWTQTRTFGDIEQGGTVSFEHIKKHYFLTLRMINPEGIIPDGPRLNIEPF